MHWYWFWKFFILSNVSCTWKKNFSRKWKLSTTKPGNLCLLQTGDFSWILITHEWEETCRYRMVSFCRKCSDHHKTRHVNKFRVRVTLAFVIRYGWSRQLDRQGLTCQYNLLREAVLELLQCESQFEGQFKRHRRQMAIDGKGLNQLAKKYGLDKYEPVKRHHRSHKLTSENLYTLSRNKAHIGVYVDCMKM